MSETYQMYAISMATIILMFTVIKLAIQTYQSQSPVFERMSKEDILEMEKSFVSIKWALYLVLGTVLTLNITSL